jgi:hypothetical protein
MIFFVRSKPSATFDFVASIGAKMIGTYNITRCEMDEYYYSSDINLPTDDQYLINIQNFKTSTTLLMIAAELNRVDVVLGLLKECVERQKEIGLLKKDSEGKTSAQISFNRGHYALTKLIDNHCHTLSDADRKKMNDQLAVVVAADTSTHEAITT